MAFATGPSFLGGMGVHSEVGVEFTKRSSLHQREYHKKIMQYQKEFNINLTRISSTEREIQQSMLAYTDRMRSLNRHRYHKKDPILDTSTLQIRARHIPRSVHLPKLTSSRRVLRKKPTNGNKTRTNDLTPDSNSSGSSDDGDIALMRQTFPPTNFPKRGSPPKEQLKMNLASAADLCELADYRTKRRHHRHVTNAFGINDDDLYSTSTNNNNKDNEGEKRETADKTMAKKEDRLPSSTLTVKDAVEQLDNKTIVKAIVRLRQIDRNLSKSSFNSRKYKKVKFRKPGLVAIPETDSGEDEEENQGFGPTTTDSSRPGNSDQSTASQESGISPLPVIKEAGQTDNSTVNLSMRNEENKNAKLDLENDDLRTVSYDNECKQNDESVVITHESKEITNFERARKQMKQKTKHNKLRFMKPV